MEAAPPLMDCSWREETSSTVFDSGNSSEYGFLKSLFSGSSCERRRAGAVLYDDSRSPCRLPVREPF